MRVLAKTPAGGDKILVHHPQRAEAHLPWVVIGGEGESVVGIEPAVVEMAALLCFANGDHGSNAYLVDM